MLCAGKAGRACRHRRGLDMALTVLGLPPNVKFRTSGWRQTGGVVYNRSVFTGAARALRLGPAARWACELAIVPSTDPAFYLQARSFLAGAARPDYAYRIPMVDLAQTATTSCLTNGTNQTGETIALDGLPNSTALLSPGALITFVFDIGQEQSCTLLEPLTSNASGQATAVIDVPLRRPIANNSTVLLAFPSCLMRAPQSLAWSVSAGQVHDFPSFTMEEVA
jgi:hypothetical protein